MTKFRLQLASKVFTLSHNYHPLFSFFIILCSVQLTQIKRLADVFLRFLKTHCYLIHFVDALAKTV